MRNNGKLYIDTIIGVIAVTDVMRHVRYSYWHLQRAYLPTTIATTARHTVTAGNGSLTVTWIHCVRIKRPKCFL